MINIDKAFQILINDIGAQQILNIFSRSIYKIRFVGGCVRDSILGIKPHDIDFVTNALPQEMINLLNDNNIQSILTGIEHGTITAVVNNKNYEITTLRQDIKCDGRHAKVAFTDSFLEDAKRRDFTFNAMSIDNNGKLYDYFNGYDDLKNKFIRFVGDADKRVKEDYLRILRFFRFYANYAEEYEASSLLACQNNANSLNKLSGERIHQEIKKILIAQKSFQALALISKCGIAKPIFGVEKLELVWFKNLQNLLIQNSYEQNYLRNLITLIYQNTVATDYIKKYWLKANKEKIYLQKMSNEDLTTICNEKFISQLIYFKGKPHVIDMILLQYSYKNKINCNNLINKIMKITIPPFPINGNDVKEYVQNDKLIGIYLKKAELEWVDSNFTLNKSSLITFIKTEISKNEK